MPDRSVSIVIVNLNGVDHLEACLDSLAGLSYPAELVETIVVDNGSTDGSRELLADRYPAVRVLPQPNNVGFAPAVSIGVEAATGECVALLNNDMRVDPGWLTAMMQHYDPDAGIVCVGSTIRSWDGTSLDFGRGSVNYAGMGHQLHFGRDPDTVPLTDGEAILFACGGAMLVGRDIYRETGGFDDSFFAYFEDVDFGWRLWVLGYEVRLATGAVCFHRLHATSSRFAEHQRLVLYERNAVQAMLKNYGDDMLGRTLGPALLMLAKRAVVRGDLPRAPYDMGDADDADVESVPRIALAHLHALADVVDSMDDLLAARRTIQQRRKRSDADIVALFVRPFQPVLGDIGYLDGHRKVTAFFGLDEVLETRAVRALVLTDGPDDLRSLGLARALHDHVEVTIASRQPVDAPGIHVTAWRDGPTLSRRLASADIVIVPDDLVAAAPELERSPAVVVVDVRGSSPVPGSEAAADVIVTGAAATVTSDASGATSADAGEPGDGATDTGAARAGGDPDAASAEAGATGAGLGEPGGEPAPNSAGATDAVPDVKVPAAILDAIAAPWPARVRRVLDRRQVLTEDVHLLLHLVGDRLDQRENELDATQAELAAAARRIEELEAIVAIWDARVDRVRRTPLYPAVKAARRVLRAVRPSD